MQKKETPAVRRLFCILKIDERGINKMAGLLLIIIFIMYIGLGIPDSLFGTAWPAIYRELDLPVGSARYVTSLISAGTIVSSFFSASLLRKFGTGLVTFFSIPFIFSNTAWTWGGSNRYWSEPLCSDALQGVPFELSSLLLWSWCDFESISDVIGFSQ